MAGFTQDYYANLLTNNPQGFLKMLDTQILKGDSSKNECLKLLGVTASHPECEKLLKEYRDKLDDSLIHNVAKFHQSTNVLKNLLAICPSLILAERTERFSGQTALHIVVTKANTKATRAILKTAASQDVISSLLHIRATGSVFANTVMMGELALSIAALTLNTNMVDLLLKNGAKVCEQNSKGDTVFHSLIRFADLHPEKLTEVISMIQHINSKMASNMVGEVWYNAQNSDHLTALKLAAQLGQVEIFSAILNLEDVYWKLNNHDGLFDNHLFDITEIDTISQAEWERNKRQEELDKKKGFRNYQSEKKPAAQSHRPALIHQHPAVLDIICQLPTATAFRLMNIDVVKDLVKSKWTYYKKFYYLWFFCHFLMMMLITVYAVFKTKVINDRIYYKSPSYFASTNYSGSSQNDISGYKTSSSVELFVFIASFISVIYATPYIIHEIFRSFYFQQRWHLGVIHHNALYRLMLLGMATALILDAILFWVKPDNNYFLVAAILIGWTFINFFLRAIRIFSFFTVMLQKVLLGDMTRFSVIIIFQLIAFTVAMYITFLNTNPVPSGFEDLGSATMTMFKLMLGLTDVEVLYDARHPWLAIFLFVACVLVTYVLLINSLIALMSQTCALVSEDRRMQWELQRLSVMHLLETILLPSWRYLHKEGLKARKFNENNTQWRCFIEITSIQTTYTDGAAIFRRKSMIRTIGFDDNSSLSLMSPFIDKFRFGRTRPSTRLSWNPIYQNFGGMMAGRTNAPASILENNEIIEESSDSENELENASSAMPNPLSSINNRNQKITEGDVVDKQTRIHSSTSGGMRDEPVYAKVQKQTGVNRPEGGKLYNDNNQNLGVYSGVPSERKKPNIRQDLSPRKRRHSERVNRKTQTVSQGMLSHSFPDSGLRVPLRQVGLQSDQLTANDASNPRIVYVIPSSLIGSENQQKESNQPESIIPKPNFSGQALRGSDITALQQIANAHASPLPEIRVQSGDDSNLSRASSLPFIVQPTPSFGPPRLRKTSQGSLPSTSSGSSVMDRLFGTDTKLNSTRTPATKVQILDIDVMHSSV